MSKIIAAFGLKNDNELTDKHFGDSIYFDVYELTENSIKYIKRINNVKVKERMHGDPNKAGIIGELLKEADILVAFRMGSNILRMKKRFVPVIINTKDIKKVEKTLILNFDKISKEVSRIGDKNYITLKIKED